MGGNTYKMMAEFAASGEPGTEELGRIRKYVVSSTLMEPFPWSNTVLIDKEPINAVRDLLEDGSASAPSAASPCAARSCRKAWSTASGWGVPRHHRGDGHGENL
ncbi:hypothetical protein [Tessaracoccus coleopterorum]|uniref:hypothetical protein n=1 Tax=Tessaracoccus coleopterorum TaxID=2714950 RepID=UPI0018D2E104|nr:hypothetical protein [Tessaracoccus coleopterorum]